MKKNNTSPLSTSDIIYEDNHLLVINKAPGLLVQGDKTGDIPLLELAKSYIKIKYNKPGEVFLGLVHRLDRPTSGVIVFARTSKALARLNQQFKSRETKKIYWAIVEGKDLPKEQELSHWLKRNAKQNKSYAYPKQVSESKEAKLYFKVRQHLKHYSLLEVDLLTGRHHQIRAQLNAIGLSIKGDLKYGAARSNPNGSIHLHARTLSLTHPVKNEVMQFVASPPKDAIWDACVDDSY
ncbi:MAG: RluA family pseudouridine synthase [Flavobacteriaceae bacterium]